jgi:hypothetical protein
MKKKYIISVGVLGLVAYLTTLFKKKKREATGDGFETVRTSSGRESNEGVVFMINDDNYSDYFDESNRATPILRIPSGVDIVHIGTTRKLHFCKIMPFDEKDSDIVSGKRLTLMGNYSVYPFSGGGYNINSYYYTYETANYESASRSNAFEDFIFWSGTWYSRFYV